MSPDHAFIKLWNSGDLTFTLQTSGSTGTPKSITLTRAQMEASARLTGQTFGLAPGDRALVCLNTAYIAGVMMLVRGAVLGLDLTVVAPSANPLGTFDPLTTRFAFAAFVPLQLQTMLADLGTSGQPKALPVLNGMKAMLVGGAATSLALEAALQMIQAPIYSTYGMTETVSHIAIRRLNGPDRSALFSVLPGVQVGTDARGCLHITAAATNHERVQTNDVVELLMPNDTTDQLYLHGVHPHGVRFRLLGRADSIINTGGVKVQPEAVEAVIQQQLANWNLSPRLFVAGLPDERLGQRIVVFCENLTLTTGQWQLVQQAVRNAISPYAVPRDWHATGTFAETPTGKIDRPASIRAAVD